MAELDKVALISKRKFRLSRLRIKTIQNLHTIQLFSLNDQFYNPFSHIVARTRKKLAKWVVKPNHYLALGFTTHLTNSLGIKALMKLAKWVVSPNR